MLRTYSPYHYAFIISLLSPLKRFTECMFLSEPECYRHASYQEAIYFVNRSYSQDEDIIYKQITCYSRKENDYCSSLSWTTDHTSNCTKLKSTKTLDIAKMPQYSFIVRCPLPQQDDSTYYYHKARAFRNNTDLNKSDSVFRQNRGKSCYCNWSDIRPNVSFQPVFAEFPVEKEFVLKLAFNYLENFHSNIKIYLATNSYLTPICEKETASRLRKSYMWCNLEKLIGCANQSLVVQLESFDCINKNYKFNITIPKKPAPKLEIFENSFICNKYSDGVEIVPVSFDESHTYFIKNSNSSGQKGLLSRRRIKLRGTDSRDIEIKVFIKDCICSQYVTLTNCHINQTTQKISRTVLAAILVSISLPLIAIICGIISKKIRNKNAKAQESTIEDIFDDSSAGMLTRHNCRTAGALSKHEDEIFDEINMPHGISL